MLIHGVGEFTDWDFLFYGINGDLDFLWLWVRWY